MLSKKDQQNLCLFLLNQIKMIRNSFTYTPKKDSTPHFKSDKVDNYLDNPLYRTLQKSSPVKQNLEQKYWRANYQNKFKNRELGLEKDRAISNLSKIQIYSPAKQVKKRKQIDTQQNKPNIRFPQINFRNKANHQTGKVDSFQIQHQKQKTYLKVQKTIEQLRSNNLKSQKKQKQYEVSKRSKAGCNGRFVKANQDLQFIEENLPFGMKLFCVCDGHGANGYQIVTFIKKRLIKNLFKNMRNLQNIEYLQQQIYFAFQKTNEQLLESEINTQLSGSTVLAIFIYQDRIICFNVGHSRAILINFQYQRWKAQQISIDHTPQRKDEADRIRTNGGRIQHLKNQQHAGPGPLRVWMKEIQSPGLPMTRSFGDKAGIKAGIIGQPQITEISIKSENKYLLIATHGVWEYLQNNEVVKQLSNQFQQGQIQAAAEKLLNKTCQEWKQKSSSRDDITFILIKLKSPNE